MSDPRRAIIVGSGGQDGRLLFDRLAAEGHAVAGASRAGLRIEDPAAGDGLPAASDAPSIILDAGAVASIVQAFRPDTIYYLAAFHHSAEDKSLTDSLALYHKSHDVHVLGLLHVLEAMRRYAPETALFYAASSHVFGDAAAVPQDETTPLRPRCVYGITKVDGMNCCRFYRQVYGLRASVGILYNHESPYRRADFLSQKIVRAAVAVARGTQSHLVLGDLSARVDWGYAPDFVEAMVRIARLPAADDFVVATGEAHTVEEFVAAAFGPLGLDWRRHVSEDPRVIVKGRASLVGDATKLRNTTGWRPTVTFEEMVGRLVRAERDRVS